MNDNQSSFFTERTQRAIALALFALTAFLIIETINSLKEYRFIGGGVPAANTITISGEGEVFAVPDIATFSFSVIEEKENAQGAQEVATEKVNTILKFVRDAGVHDTDIKTTRYNVSPRYEYVQESCNEFRCPPGKRVLRGFEVNQTVEIKVRDTSKAGEILAGVGARGASNVSGLSFTIDDEEGLLRDARALAIDDARTKAKELAGDLGVRLVRVVSFSESGARPPIYRFGDDEVRALAVPEAAATPEIPVGKNKLTSTVSITYEIR